MSRLPRPPARALLTLLLATPAPAQILTTDAAVRSPELPSVRALLAYRTFDSVDEARVAGQVVYSPNHDFELELEGDWIAREVDDPERGIDGRVSGLSDLSLRGKLEIVRVDDVMRSDRVSVLGRLIVPTGESDATLDGQRLHPRLQPGLGSFGFGLGAGATIVRDRHRASAVVEWTHRLPHDGFDPGADLALDLAWWYRLAPAVFEPGDHRPEWRAVVEVRTEYGFEDSGRFPSDGDRGTRIDGLLGLQVNFGTAVRGDLALVVPLLDDADSPFGEPGLGVIAGVTLYF